MRFVGWIYAGLVAAGAAVTCSSASRSSALDCMCHGGGTATSPERAKAGDERTAAIETPKAAATSPAAAPASAPLPQPLAADDPAILKPGETRYLSNVRQLTFGQPKDAPADAPVANYAEAYWSPDGQSLTMQATRGAYACDQIFRLDVATGKLTLISTGTGRTTCSYFTADGQHIIYSSTHDSMGAACPPPVDMSHGYVWPVYSYDIFEADARTGKIERQLTTDPGYDAESTIDWHSGWIYYTSSRDGDLDIYRMQVGEDGKTWHSQRLTDAVGYDGGPFVSYDGKTVVYRRDNQDTPEKKAQFSELLDSGLVKPTQLEIWAMNADGSNKRQLTHNGQANFAPFLHPDNQTLIFCSNVADTAKHRKFELWAMPLDGSHAPVRITQGEEFDGFPMFSPDGKRLAWCSNRNHAVAHETNVFVADWNGIDWSKE